MTPERVHVYEILEPAPRGGPGRAFRARVAESAGPLGIGSIVQLRIVTENEAGGAAAIQELVTDHGAARRIANRSVAAPVDFGVSVGPDGRRFWSASPWSEGRTLTEVLAGAESVPDLLVDAIAKQAADAMNAVHRAGLRAIGLSPDALLVQEDASILLLDVAFGAAHVATWPRVGPTPPSLACAAPETIRARARADERADVYSLGAALFRAMTGRWPRPDDAQALVCEPESFTAPRPSDVHPRLSLFLDEFVFALLEVDRAKRFASFDVLVAVLDKRRDSDWWRGLHIAQETYVDERLGRDRIASEPSPPPIPAPAAAPDAQWMNERRRREFHLARHAAPLVGREDDLRGLVDAASRLADRGGQVRLVQGAGGTGKTRLVDAMLDAVAQNMDVEAPLVLAGEHRRLGIGRPMRAFTEALTRLIAADRDVEAAQVAPLLGDASAVAPAFAAFLSGREPPEKSTPLTRESIAAAFIRALSTLAAASPVVLVVENLQWADPEGLDLFAQLARAVSDMPVLLVGTYRPVEKSSPLAQALAPLRACDNVATVKLDALAETETLRLVLSMVATDDRAVALARRVHAASQGVALRVVETLRLLEAEGALARDSAGRLCATDEAASSDMPATENDVWTRRVAMLSTPERAILSMAVVQGFAFDADVTTRALKLDFDAAERALFRLVAGSLVDGAGPARRFADNSLFDHVHDALDDAALEACHEATANAFLASRNPEGRPPAETHGILSYRVAWHYLLAGRAARGLLYVEPAMRHLRSTWRLGDAERLADLAVRTLAGEPDRAGDLVDMLLVRAEVLGLQSRRAEQRDLLTEALARARDAKDSVREARVLLDSARQRFAVREIHGAVAEGEEALAAARESGDPVLETKCRALLGNIAFHEGRFTEAREQTNVNLETARRRGDAQGEAEALQTLGAIAQSVGTLEHAEELHRAAMNIWRREGDLVHEAEAVSSLGEIAAIAGDLVKAEGLLRRALAIARATGDGHGEARVLGRLGMILQEGQRCDEARALHHECLKVSRRLSARHNEVVALLNLATVEYVLGRLDDARSCYGDAMRVARELRDSRLMGYGLTGLGEVARQAGESETARGLFDRAVAQFRRSEDQAGLAAALLAAGRIEVLGGDAVHAQTMLAEARELAAVQSAPYVGALATGFLALLAARRGAAEEALSSMAESGAMVACARADATRVEMLFVHALVQRVLGRRVEADRLTLQAEKLVMETTLELSRDDRDRVFSVMSPAREILAGAVAARAASKSRDGSPSATVAV